MLLRVHIRSIPVSYNICECCGKRTKRKATYAVAIMADMQATRILLNAKAVAMILKQIFFLLSIFCVHRHSGYCMRFGRE